MSQLLLLLGAGISRPSGYPLTRELTEHLSRSHFVCEAEEYISVSDPPTYDPLDDTPSVQKLYNHLIGQFRADANYEIVQHLARRLWRSLDQEGDDPPDDGFLHCTFPFLKMLSARHRLDDVEYATPRELLIRVDRFIETAIVRSLRVEREPSGLDLLRELIEDRPFHRITIATLNHDTLVERFLKANYPARGSLGGKDGLLYVDGFGPEGHDVRWYQPSKLRKPNDKHLITLLKLHGSVDWLNLGKEVNGRKIYRNAIPLNNDYRKLRDDDDHPLTHYGASILCGGEKELLYQSGIFADMFDAFVISLSNTGTVVSSGFGWNDLGIALRILSWLATSDENRRLVMHKSPDSILESRGGLLPRFREYYNKGRIVFIPAHFCDVGLDQLIATLS